MRELISKSLRFDLSIATIQELSLPARAHFLGQKVIALGALGRGRSFRFHLGAAGININSISDLGTLQSCVVDFHDELMIPRLLSDTPCIVDVGANIGQWTSSVKLFIPNAQILALEPDPVTFDHLKKNVSSLQGVECIHCAAGSKSGFGLLYRQPLSIMSTLSPSKEDELDDTVEVPIRVLDELLQDYTHIDLLKIDVEGSEVDVLRGAELSLEKSSLLLVEMSLARGQTMVSNFLPS
ncbi:MAG: FkbM family methyltransferase [Ferrimicrobium sp.]